VDHFRDWFFLDMIKHVVPGDAYLVTFRETHIDGDIAIFREALVDGPLDGETLTDLWKTRDRFHSASANAGDQPYTQYVVMEIEKFAVAKAGDEVNLWFEYELFCSVNYWFCMHLLKDSQAAIFRVAPAVRDVSTRWLGFGSLSADAMSECFEHRIRLNDDDVKLGSDLWLAFKTRDKDRLIELGSTASPAFPYLIDVAEAADEIETKPKKILEEIIAEGSSEFADIFPEFSKRGGVYGFGDSQVKHILDGITH
jgi:hypothetical protein